MPLGGSWSRGFSQGVRQDACPSGVWSQGHPSPQPVHTAAAGPRPVPVWRAFTRVCQPTCADGHFCQCRSDWRRTPSPWPQSNTESQEWRPYWGRGLHRCVPRGGVPGGPSQNPRTIGGSTQMRVWPRRRLAAADTGLWVVARGRAHPACRLYPGLVPSSSPTRDPGKRGSGRESLPEGAGRARWPLGSVGWQEVGGGHWVPEGAAEEKESTVPRCLSTASPARDGRAERGGPTGAREDALQGTASHA